jgi:acyl-CoA reductase-like NAD-dependent aldehyde dehydrogenase
VPASPGWPGTFVPAAAGVRLYHFHEPLGVVGQIIPFNFPLLMAAWKLAPALAGGNCTVIKPASTTPWSILKLAELIGDVVPPGVLNIVTGPGGEIGKALATSRRIAKIAFTGETVTGRLIMQYAAGLAEGAELLIGGKQPKLEGELADGYFFEPTVLKGHNKMRVFQEEIFGPVLAVTTFKDEADALEIANDTLYGLGAGVWTRDGSLAYRMGRAIKAGRVWTNCYHQYPAGAAFGGYKMSGVGRELYRETLTEHYSQTKSLLVSYSDQALGLF